MLLLPLALFLTPWARPALAQQAAPAGEKSAEERPGAAAGERADGTPDSEAVTFGTLDELRGKHYARLLVIRPRTVSANDPAQGVAAAVVAAGETERRLRWVHDLIARRLNKYIRKYRSMTAAPSPSDADFVVVFNLLRYRRTLNGIYPSGEMYLITHKAPAPPRVLWRTEKEMFEEDATNQLLKAIKAARGEK